jgi:sec-independent protein translocase protein TatB
MFGIGMPEFLLILVVALVVLGPKRLPEMARSLGRGLAELKKTTGDLKQNIDLGEDLNKVQKDLQEVKSHLSGVIETNFLEDTIPDYLKDTEPQAEVKPESAAEADLMPSAAPPVPTETPLVITGGAEDIRRELEEMADLAYRENHPYSGELLS